MGFDPETFDPEELVTVDGIGEMTLKSAVERLSSHPLGVSVLATISRGMDCEPTLLGRDAIAILAKHWDI
jgi:hypothetical protein